MAVKMIGRGGFRRWEFLTLWVSDEHEDVYEENLEADTEAEGEGDEDDEPRDAEENPAADTDAVVRVLLRCDNFITVMMMRMMIMMMMRRRMRI